MCINRYIGHKIIMLTHMSMAYNICELDLINEGNPLPRNVDELNIYDENEREEFRMSMTNRFSLPKNMKIEEIYNINKHINGSFKRIYQNDEIVITNDIVIYVMKMMRSYDYEIGKEKRYMFKKLSELVDKDYDEGRNCSELERYIIKLENTTNHIDTEMKRKGKNRYTITYYINDILYGYTMIERIQNRDIQNSPFIIMKHMSKTVAAYIVESVYGIELPKINVLLLPIVEQIGRQIGATRVYTYNEGIQNNNLVRYYGFNIVDEQNKFKERMNIATSNNILYKDIVMDEDNQW